MTADPCKFIWIVGSPRSGTTFLTRLIGDNCDLTYDEPGDIPHLQRGKVGKWHFPPAKTICFKWCENYRVADPIVRKFPNSYFIHITREPQNNVYSIAFPKESAFPPRQFPELGDAIEERMIRAIRMWFGYDQGCRQLRKQLGSRYLEVPYEQLPDYYGAIETFTGIKLTKRPEFSNQNLPQGALEELTPYWQKTPFAKRYADSLVPSESDPETSVTANDNTEKMAISAPTLAPPPMTTPGEKPSFEPFAGNGLRSPTTTTALNSALWTDHPDAKAMIKHGLEAGSISWDEAENLRFFCDQGYLVIPDALPDDLTESILNEILTAWSNPTGETYASFWEGSQKRHLPSQSDYATRHEAKLLDIHMVSESVRAAIFHEQIRRYLTLILQDEPLAFQSLSFEKGSEQGMHSDIAFVKVDEPRNFVASWIALEDVHPGTGELEYYPGSHKIPDHVFDNGSVWQDAKPTGYERLVRSLFAKRSDRYQRLLPKTHYTRIVHKLAKENGLLSQRFLPRKGDALIWSSGLYHGGSKIENPQSTRRSLVTHYCPQRCTPPYLKEKAGKQSTNHGGHVCGQYTKTIL
ncbi:Phytanoyl-CoA dioxygenase family protein [Luminiphilus syltensis NOR5-1B]|uniref:Phytanoyl-CoA dioxygenase family protein n=1 Tax=Luminiphilus syltensis NOR5-1B TaxID=565045 RepID=B8KWK5_9GAMM|nr:phytanoyl-CoA dioxygenase family protein [Luminiphilus syltensis]EED34440.1 Phytanoyl-CoA dioxygenase family protein [Luminiphilus syltensis NOR5-1B]